MTWKTNKHGHRYYDAGKNPTQASLDLAKEHPKSASWKMDVFGNHTGTKYDIVRFYRQEGKRYRVMQRNLDADVAHRHVNDPKTRKEGVYFDGFSKAGQY